MLSLRYAYDLIFHFLSSLCSNVTLSVRTSLIILFNPLPEETLPISFCASFIYPFLKTYTGSLLFVLPVSVSPLDCQPHEGRDLYVFFFSTVVPRGMRDLSSQTRDQTQTLCYGSILS